MRGGPRPQTPAEHYAEAVSLANDSADLPATSPAALVYAQRAAAHAALALYAPPLVPAPAVVEIVTAPDEAPEKKTTARRPRKAATTKETAA